LPPRKWGWRAALLAVVALAAGAVIWGSQSRNYLCDRFGLFCDPELVAYRDAQSCAAPKTCGASECVARYRDHYPNGRFKAQIDELAVSKGRACVVEVPRPDPERLAYDRVTACAEPKSCGASVCVTEYRQSFPNGAHKADVDRIVAQKGADCVDTTEKEVYDQAVGCARPRTCGGLECVAEYRRRYPNGRYKADIEQIATQKGVACLDPVEKATYDRADACARPKTCGALDCLADYRRDYPNGRFKAEIDRIAQLPKAVPCPDLDKEAYDRAERCATPLRCGADHCLVEYRRDFSNGRYRSLIEQIGTLKGAACQPTPTPSLTATATPTNSPSPTATETPLPPFVAARPGDDARITCGPEPIAQMICKDSDMARANGELQQAFAAKRGRMRDASDLVTDERAWIARRNRECGAPPSGSWEINDLRKLKNCVLDMTRARINELRQ
jgi:uncharacterized protein YecT (DUF1311 family)